MPRAIIYAEIGERVLTFLHRCRSLSALHQHTESRNLPLCVASRVLVSAAMHMQPREALRTVSSAAFASFSPLGGRIVPSGSSDERKVNGVSIDKLANGACVLAGMPRRTSVSDGSGLRRGLAGGTTGGFVSMPGLAGIAARTNHASSHPRSRGRTALSFTCFCRCVVSQHQQRSDGAKPLRALPRYEAPGHERSKRQNQVTQRTEALSIALPYRVSFGLLLQCRSSSCNNVKSVNRQQ